MAAGHIINGQCVDVAVSTDLFWSNFEATAQSGSNLYITVASKTSGIWQLETYLNGSLYSTVAAPVPSFASCDTTEQFFDGMAIGWLVVGAMVAAFSIHLLRRALS